MQCLNFSWWSIKFNVFYHLVLVVLEIQTSFSSSFCPWLLRDVRENWLKKKLYGERKCLNCHILATKKINVSIYWISMEVVFPYKYAMKNQSGSIKFLYSFNLFLIIKGCFDVRKKFIEVLNFLLGFWGIFLWNQVEKLVLVVQIPGPRFSNQNLSNRW